MNGKAEIWELADRFREKHLGSPCYVPVDVLTVIEVRLRLDVIPFDRLMEKYSVDAAVMPDFSGIYVDKRSYGFLEGQPPWLFNRLRFSLAHELGHILLHRDLAGGLSFKTLEDYRAWMRRYEASRYGLEWEANEFAGRLLIPSDRLKADFDVFVQGACKTFPAWWTHGQLREALCSQLGESYGVHKDVISCRLDREDLWPNP